MNENPTNAYDEIDKYASELEMDTQVDSTNIFQKQLSAPNVRHKWLYRLVMCKKKLYILSEQKDNLINEMMKTSRLPVSNIAARKNFEKEPNIVLLDKEISKQELLVDYLDSAVKQLNQIGFDYRNLVELLKLEQL
jgi:hypothetical protein